MRQTADVVIVGGGFAGAATAHQLARRGVKKVVLLEQEDLLGRHSSGRNAGMARRLVMNRTHLPLAIEGIRFMEEPPDGFPPGPYFRRTGAMMLAGPELEASLRASIAAVREAGVRAEWLGAPEVERLVPVTRGGSFVGAAYAPDDGIADVAALLDAYLRTARAGGLEIHSGERLIAMEAQGDTVTGVRTSQGYISTGAVVNAAGAWASQVGRLARASPVPLRSLQRHVMVSATFPGIDRSWPFVWDVTHDVYFRPEPPGLLLSPCDATETEVPGEATNAGALETLAEKLTRWLPRLAGLSIANVWAGLRTFAPDGNPVLGPDPFLRGFFWCAGLGGNGMTVSAPVGRIVAESVIGQPTPYGHAAARFVTA